MSWSNLKYSLGIFLSVLRKTTNTSSTFVRTVVVLA